MESLPYVVFQKRSTNDSELSAEETARVKKKAKIQAKLVTQENTAHHPCNEDPGTGNKLPSSSWQKYLPCTSNDDPGTVNILPSFSWQKYLPCTSNDDPGTGNKLPSSSWQKYLPLVTLNQE